MKGFCPLSSGSKGNCTFLGTEETKILIDAGISTKTIIERLNLLNVRLEEIDAILITHEHSDHIAGLKTLAFQFNIPILANQETAKSIVESFRSCPKFKIFSTGETFELADLEIHPFPIPHDAIDPVGFTVKTGGLKLGFCTDLGFATSVVQHQLKNCDYLVLESNHKPEMVHASSRPPRLKQRILGKNGHLSNEHCGQLLTQIFHADLKHVYLAHLSGECNSPKAALDTVKAILDSHQIQVNLSVAPQFEIAQPIYF